MASVLVPLAQGCEELEAVTVIDLMVRAGIEVTSAGLDNQPVRASRGVTIIPDTDLDTALQKEYDMIVLPGGLPGADNLAADPRIIQRLQAMSATNRYTAAVCAAPKVLSQAGLLKGKQATSYPGALNAEELDGVDYRDDAVVVDGYIVTSRGPGTVMDFTLSLIALLVGKDKADEVDAGLKR